MNLVKIQYFVEAAKCLSFSEAARRLYTTQPNLSRQLALMEDELGVKLFVRSNKSVTLTPAGNYLLEQLHDVPKITSRAFEHVRAFGRGESGTVYIGILDGGYVFPETMDGITKIQELHPNASIHFERNTFSGLRRGVMSQQYDIILTHGFELGELEYTEHVVLEKQVGVLCTSMNHPKANLPNPRLEDFMEEGFVAISPDESQGGYDLFVRECRAHGFEPKIVRLLYNTESLMLAVESGFGIALLDLHCRLQYSEHVRMIELPGSSSSDLIAVWHKSNKNPLIGKIIEAIKN